MGKQRLVAWLGALVILAGCRDIRPPRLLETWPTGAAPAGLALSPEEDRLAVACPGSKEVWIYDLGDAGHASRRFDVEKPPSHLLFSPDSLALYVSEPSADRLLKIDLKTLRVLRQGKTGSQPSQLCFSEDDSRLFVSCRGSQVLSVLKAQDLSHEKDLSLGGSPRGLCLAPEKSRAYVATQEGDSLSAVFLPDRSLRASIQAGPDPEDVAVSPDRAFAYVACRGLADAFGNTKGVVTAVRLKDWVAVDHANVGAGALAIACSPSGNFIFVACHDSGTLEVLSTVKGLQRVAVLKLKYQPSDMRVVRGGERAYLALENSSSIGIVDLEGFP